MQKIAINRRFDDIKDKKIDSTNDNLEKKEAEPIRVVRQYINPAIYVESCVYDMAPFKRSPVFLNYYSDDDSARRVVKVKRCVCLTNPYNCPCHPSIPNTEHSDTSPRVNLQSNRKKSNSASVSQVSLKSDETATTLKQNASELKLSIPSLATTCVSFNLDYQQEAFKSWCARKDKERKRIEEERLKQNQLKEEERQRQLEEERENFRRWLLNKKKEEERRRREREFEIEQDKVKEETKEKRRVENELKYKLWLKQKEELYLEKKIKEQMDFLKAADEKQRRIEKSMRAYEEWLKNSKYKPKPVPSNQGLQSLKTSVSVTYINPTPWVPNIDNNTQKPASQ